MSTTGAAPFTLPAPQLEDEADIEKAVVPLRDRLQVVLPAMVPVGAMMMWFTDTAPLWWLMCNGQDVDELQYPRLVPIFGASGGRIYLPNLKDRIPLGASPTRALRSTGGVESVTLTEAQIPAHDHDDSFAVANAPAMNTGTESVGHTHTYLKQSAAAANVPGGAGVAVARAGLYDTVGGGGDSTNHVHTLPAHGHTLNGVVLNAGGGQAHENMQPWLAVNFIVRAE